VDSDWYAFAEMCQKEFERCTFQTDLVKACGGNEDMAWVAYFHLRDDAVNWFSHSIPSLDGRVPGSLIDEGNGDEVRHCLWAFPC
jgi:hypothetical protein